MQVLLNLRRCRQNIESGGSDGGLLGCGPGQDQAERLRTPDRLHEAVDGRERCVEVRRGDDVAPTTNGT